jgi:malonyl-CoA/methylmalonyl-CoA synthetase
LYYLLLTPPWYNSVNLPLITRAQSHSERTAIVTPKQRFSYQDLLDRSAQIATALLNGMGDLAEQRVAFLLPSGFDYVATQWGIWRAGGIAVPLCTVHPRPELEYVINQSGASILLADDKFADRLLPIAEDYQQPLLLTSHILGTIAPLPVVALDRRALILYTSGTTGKPKGVVMTHANIQAQVTSLIAAWAWQPEDRILHLLPLHHIHGIINVLTCALWSGAECHMLPKFDAETVWGRISDRDLTLFMAVPTIYAKLIAAWSKASKAEQEVRSLGCQQMRLMVSGSAALPVQVLETWQQISGHVLLERYGMTEIGMALSNPLEGERLAGSVGQPLPGVAVRLVDEAGAIAMADSPGEIQVQGPGVFLEYWQNPEATTQAFCAQWFRTGDMAIAQQGTYRILGRISVDIIKTGGYKVSALEIEEVLRSHPEIQDCAVVGVMDDEWGERVCAALVITGESSLTLADFRAWAKEQLATYKVPTKILILESLPRNAMGKVMKPAIVELFELCQS